MEKRGADQAGGKPLKPWKAPVLEKYDLTEDELAKLRASDDPMALLLTMRPELKANSGT